MNPTFLRASSSSTRRNDVPVIPPASLGLYDPGAITLESDAYEHWILGGSSSSLTGRVNGRALTPLGSGQSYQTASVTIPGKLNGLASNMPDGKSQTMIAVVKRPNTTAGQDNLVVCGASTQTGTEGGSLIYFAGFSTTPNVTGLVRQNSASSLVTPLPAVADGTWLFLAMTENTNSGGRIAEMYIGGVGQTVVTLAGAKLVGNRFVALGNGYYDGSTFDGQSLVAAEFILFPRRISVTQIGQIYARSKARLAPRGVAVY